MDRVTRQSRSTVKKEQTTKSTRATKKLMNESKGAYSKEATVRSTRKRKARKFFDESDYEDCDRNDNLKRKKCAYFESSNYYSSDYEDSNQSILTDDNYSIDKSSSFNEDSNQSSSTIIQEQSSEDLFFDYLTIQDDLNLIKLNLPASSEDLVLSETDVNNHLMQICSIYEIFKNFRDEIRLSPFRPEEFICALQLNESNSLFAEIHIALLKSLIRDDKLNGMQICSSEYKDSVNIHLHLLDALTWPEILKIYLKARANGPRLTYNDQYIGDKDAKFIINDLFKQKPYSSLSSLKVKLTVLQYLCEAFLQTKVARDKIHNIEQEKALIHDYHCRECSDFGDLLCCDNCNSAWHLSILFIRF